MVEYKSKHVFWQALVFTVIIFAMGLILGFYLESSRTNEVELRLLGSEVNLLDEQLRGELTGNSNLSCGVSVQSTFAFADKIYGEALKLEEYDLSSKFTKETLLSLHRRYDLLRVLLWTETIKLKDRCGGFHTVVYFFDYLSDDISVKARERFFSNLLTDIKERNAGKVLLIPIASDLDLASIELAMKSYNIVTSPSILIDEEKIVNNVITIEELEKIIFSD
ncbi:hypothetical protein J4229_00550 [Candidatus Pacearchaeota archaeon]|nr:hypothetical protein [Candidatus Pacearchaeota archaeon]